MSLCGTCHNRAFNVCGGCKSAYYCDKLCQSKDWNSHKLTCDARLFEKDLSQEAKNAKKTSIEHKIQIPVKWPEGSISFGVMVLPSITEIDDSEMVFSDEEEDDELMGDDDLIPLYTEDPTFQKLKEEYEKLLQNEDSTDNIEYEIEKRKEVLKSQKKILEYLNSPKVDYYVSEEAFTGGKHYFYIVIKKNDVYQSVLEVFRTKKNDQKEPIFASKIMMFVDDFVKSNLLDLSYDAFVKKPVKSITKQDEEEEDEKVEFSQGTEENKLLSGITQSGMFKTLIDPVLSTFLTRNNIRFTSLRNTFILIKQLKQEVGENSLKKAGSIRSYKEWQKLGYYVRKGQHGLKIITPTFKENNVQKFALKVTGFDESQTSVNPKDVKYTKHVQNEEESNEFVSYDNINLATLLSHFRKDYNIPKLLKKIGKENVKIVDILDNSVDDKPHITNLEIFQFDLPDARQNKIRIVFHMMAHYLLGHVGTSVEYELQSEAVALLACNMIGIHSETYHKILTKSIFGENRIIGFDEGLFKRILDASKKIIFYASKKDEDDE